MEDDRETYTFREAGEILGLSRERVRQLVEEGRIHVRPEDVTWMAGRRYRLIRRGEVERYRRVLEEERLGAGGRGRDICRPSVP